MIAATRFFPEVPTLTELGIGGVELGNWFGIFAPASTPKSIISRLSVEVATALGAPEVKQRFQELGAETVVQDAETFRKTIADETKVVSKLIRERNIVAD